MITKDNMALPVETPPGKFSANVGRNKRTIPSAVGGQEFRNPTTRRQSFVLSLGASMRFHCVGISAFALLVGANTAYAQSTTVTSPSNEPQKKVDSETNDSTSDAVTDSSTASQAIVVTGSRLPSEFSLDAPVQSITPGSAMTSGSATVAEMASRATAAAGTQQINNRLSATGAGGSVDTGGTNAETISLRNLGGVRTLTMLNGQRLTPSGTGSRVGPVDYNVIPSVAIDHIEVLTTGASSVYGSDAIGGVVNVLMRKGGNGLEVNAFTRLPEKTGGRYVEGTLYWGQNFDRGYAGIGLEYDQQFALKMKDRPQTACAQNFVYDVATNKRADTLDSNGNIRCYNHSPTGVFFDRYYYNGSFVYDPSRAGGPYPAVATSLHSAGSPLNNWVRGGLGGYPDTYSYLPTSSSAYENADSIAPWKRFNAYLSAGYDINDSTEIYLSAIYSHRQSASNSWYFLYPYLAATNPNNTVGQALINASGGQSDGEVIPQLVRPFRSEQKVDYFQSTLGLKGQFGGDWKYDVSSRVGISRGSYGQTFYYQDRINASTAAGTACDPSLITISGPVSCMSIPWLSKRFLSGNWTQAETNYLEGFEWGRTSYDEFSLDGNITGSLFSLPAGKVAASLGFSIRTEDLDDQPGHNAQNHNYFSFSTAGRTAGSDTVKEVFGEIGIPIIADKRFFRRLSLVASGRYTDYSSYGASETYRLSGLWQVAKTLAFRLGYGTSFRAPSLYELNLASQSSFFNYFDPCMRYGDGAGSTVVANCKAEGFSPTFSPVNSGIEGISGGGKGTLKAETSHSLNAGIVIRPPIAGMELAADYYDIVVDNEIGTYGVYGIVNSCYAMTTNRETFCSLITRDPVTKAITEVNNRYINLAGQRTRGIDIALHLTRPLSRDIRIGLDVRASRTLENSIKRDELTPRLDQNGLSGFPKLTGNMEVNVSRKSVTWFVGADYIGSVNDTPYYKAQGNFYNGTTNFCWYGAYAGLSDYGNSNACTVLKEKLSVSAQVTLYTSVEVRIGKKMKILAGISNILDKSPPVIGPDAYTYRVGSVPGNLYNIVGRTFYLRLSQKF